MADTPPASSPPSDSTSSAFHIVQPFVTEGIGVPVHSSAFQLIFETYDVTLVFTQKKIEYGPSNPAPTVSNRVVAQIGMSHMMAKDLQKQLTRAITDFERQYPIPEVTGPLLPPSRER